METIEVRYSQLSWAGYYHQYIVYTDSNGNQYIARGGPSGSQDGGYGTIETYTGIYDNLNIDWDWENDDPSEVVASGEDLSSAWDEIARNMREIGQENHEYNPLDTNSNTAVAEALDRSGVDEPQNDGFWQNWSPGSENDLDPPPGGDTPAYEIGDEVLGILDGGNKVVIARDIDGTGTGGVGILDADTGAFEPVLDIIGDLARSLLPPSWQRTLDDFFNPPPIDPLVIDLDGDGVELTALSGSQAFFDLDGDGFAEQTGWVHSDDALLAVDRNGNGQIDDISELLGSQQLTGYQELAEFDTNGDGVVDVNDAGYSELSLWRDFNGDGVTDAGELFTLSELGVATISLDVTATSFEINGNEVIETSTVTFADGTVQQSVEVLFELSQAKSVFNIPDGFTFNPSVFTHPTLRGFGELPDLWIGMSLDAGLMPSAATAIQMMRDSGYDAFELAFQAFLGDWAGAAPEGYSDPPSDYILPPENWGLKAQFLEALMGQDLPVGDIVFNTHVLIPTVIAQFEIVRDYFAPRFLAQAAHTVIATEGSNANLGFLEPFQHLHYDPFSDAIAGDVNLFAAAFIEQFRTEGQGSDADAMSILALFKDDLPSLATVLLDPDLNLDRDLIKSHFEVTDIVEGTNGADNIVGTQDGILVGNAGDDTLSGSTADTTYFGGTGDDQLDGTQLSDHYVYRLGDGNDVISDTDLYNNDGFDTLSFTDVASDDVTFSLGANADLVIALPNGETVTVSGHFSEGEAHAVEVIHFSDGISLDYQSIRDKLVADQKADGATVTGTLYTENYVHRSGDGSYTILDTDLYNNDGVDTLTFSDVAASEVTFTRSASGSDLIITLPNGETVTVQHHFSEGKAHAIETISFADGVTLDYQAIRDKSVADQKVDGATVRGTLYTENYVHTSGDGSYTIVDTDLYNNDGVDTLTFTDVASTDVVFGQGSNSALTITLLNGEIVTVQSHFSEGEAHAIETITFADGVSLDYQAIRDKSVADQKADGATVRGTLYTENYVHTSGDGSYAIVDTDIYNNDGVDTLTLTDVASADAVFTRASNDDLIITLPNGETVTVKAHFADHEANAVEAISFSDGVTLDVAGILAKSIPDQKSTGSVHGGEEATVYTHALGEGSYTIYDWDNDHRTDQLIFTDLNPDDVTFNRGSGGMLEITVPDGAVITVHRHFAEDLDEAIEEIHFADGTVLDLEGIRLKTVADQKASGSVSGDAYADTYYHTLGDGSYTIYDWDNDHRTDKLVFTDLNVTDVTFARGSGGRLEITAPDGAIISVNGHFVEDLDEAIEEIHFADGTVLDLEAIRLKSVADQKSSGTVFGNDHADTYYHALGDGTYTIFDWDNNARTDRLIFTDLNAGDVTFRSTFDEHLVIAMSDGAEITVFRHFTEDLDEAIEQIQFADGTVLDFTAILNKSVADQKASGIVVGSDFAETYMHTLGDGSYTIYDWDNNARTDRLIFTDQNASEVTFNATFDGHLEITSSDGAKITVFKHFEEDLDEAIEQIEFADGTVLNLHGIRLKSVADQKPTGNVVGDDYSDTYYHTLGDGSYTIYDWDNNARTDRFVFTDLNMSDVTFQQGASNDLEILFSNGDQVTIYNHFEGDLDEAIEEFVFADGTVISGFNILDYV